MDEYKGILAIEFLNHFPQLRAEFDRDTPAPGSQIVLIEGFTYFHDFWDGWRFGKIFEAARQVRNNLDLLQAALCQTLRQILRQ